MRAISGASFGSTPILSFIRVAISSSLCVAAVELLSARTRCSRISISLAEAFRLALSASANSDSAFINRSAASLRSCSDFSIRDNNSLRNSSSCFGLDSSLVSSSCSVARRLLSLSICSWADSTRFFHEEYSSLTASKRAKAVSLSATALSFRATTSLILSAWFSLALLRASSASRTALLASSSAVSAFLTSFFTDESLCWDWSLIFLHLSISTESSLNLLRCNSFIASFDLAFAALLNPSHRHRAPSLLTSLWPWTNSFANAFPSLSFTIPIWDSLSLTAEGAST